MLLPPCQLIRPVVDAPNLEAPCPFTGYSRGSVRRRPARGLMRIGMGWDVRSLSLALSLSACVRVHAAFNEEERKKNRAGQPKTLGLSHPQLRSYKLSNFQTFFPSWMSWGRYPFSIVFN